MGAESSPFHDKVASPGEKNVDQLVVGQAFENVLSKGTHLDSRHRKVLAQIASNGMDPIQYGYLVQIQIHSSDFRNMDFQIPQMFLNPSGANMSGDGCRGCYMQSLALTLAHGNKFCAWETGMPHELI